MIWAVAPDDTRIHAHPNLTGTCPACTAPVYPKCGDEIVWHWAHKVGDGVDCELGEGIDLDEHTGWHETIQTYAQGEGATIEATHPTEKRRADIRTPAGLVIELQHSRIDRDTLLGREHDWLPEGPMCWLWDAAEWAKTYGAPCIVEEIPAKPIIIGATPIFIDIRHEVLQIVAIDKYPHGGRYRTQTIRVLPERPVLEFIGRLIAGNIPAAWTKPPAWITHPTATGPTPTYAPAPPAPVPFTYKPTCFCSAPSFAGTFSGDKCGLTATDGTDLCWAHLATRQQEAAS